MSTPSLHETAKRTRILIVDDHAMLREGLATLITSQPDMEVCGQACDATEALEQIAQSPPDLVTVDLSLKNGHGLDLIKQIRAYDGNIKMLVLSMHDENLFAERAIRAGAVGYLNKEESGPCLLEAIRTIMEDRVYLSPRMTARVLTRQVGKTEEDRSAIESLSDRELQVFEAIGNGMSTRGIAAMLQLSPKTVETYRENIKAKLDVGHANELIRYAVQWVMQEASSGGSNSERIAPGAPVAQV